MTISARDAATRHEDDGIANEGRPRPRRRDATDRSTAAIGVRLPSPRSDRAAVDREASASSEASGEVIDAEVIERETVNEVLKDAD